MALPGWLRMARWPAVAALGTLLVVWGVTLERELARRAPGPAPGPEVEALSRRFDDVRTIVITEEPAPGRASPSCKLAM